jgi:hypothetical protein
LGALPDGLAATVATSLYWLAAAVLALEGLNALLAGHGSGAGQWLSAAAVALAMAVGYGVSLWRASAAWIWSGS